MLLDLSERAAIRAAWGRVYHARDNTRSPAAQARLKEAMDIIDGILMDDDRAARNEYIKATEA